jgi:uncharacterized protein YcnI
MRKALVTVAAAFAALVAVGVATAHVFPATPQAPAGNSTIIPFVVPHGCEGSATRSVSIRIAAGVTSVKPQPKPGWRLSITRGRLPVAVKDFEGNTVTRGVLAVTWSGGNLPDSQMDTFNILLGMPNSPGKTLYFPTVQRCTRGVTRWIQIPKAGQAEPDSPAPGVRLVKSSGGHG